MNMPNINQTHDVSNALLFSLVGRQEDNAHASQTCAIFTILRENTQK
jgi:hypothetical protein